MCAVVVIVLGLSTIPLAWLTYRPIQLSELPILIYLAVGTQIAQLRPIEWRSGHQTVVDPLLIATGLFAPGAGVGAVACMTTYDGRVPGRSIPWWAFLFRPAESATIHVLPSIAVASIGSLSDWWSIPVRTVIYGTAVIALNYGITALVISLVRREAFFTTLLDNVGLPTTAVTMSLSFAGGVLFLLLRAQPSPVGYILAPFLFIFVLAVRDTIADVQRQTVRTTQTLRLLARSLDARDPYTEQHSSKVSELAARLGEQLELDDRECERIRMAGALHDLGKIGIRDDILNKPGPLSEEEWDIMRQHPDIGAGMIAEQSELLEVAPYVRHHHERWDGSGYPARLEGEKIPFGARILSVADSFDTITGVRKYRRSAMTDIEAVEDISRRANQWYDPNVVDALRQLKGLEPLEVPNRPEVPRRITTYRVLRSSPGFSSLITAVGISSLGDSLTQVAVLVTIFIATRGQASFVTLAFVTQAFATFSVSAFLGGVSDRFARRSLIVGLELSRAALLVVTALLVTSNWWVLFPVLLLLASVNAIVQPARQASIPELVPAAHIGKATAMVTRTTVLTGAFGYGVAGAFLTLYPRSTTALFVADGITFALAAAIMVGLPNLGGGIPKTSLSGALRRTWAIGTARPHLVIGTLAACLIPMSFPALLALAYQVSCPIGSQCAKGGQTYSALELVLALGLSVGSFWVARSLNIGTIRTVGAGLLMTGAFSLLVAAISTLAAVLVLLFLASIGNAVYQVANTTALMESADATNRGGVMATRFGLVQTASIIGIIAGGVVTQRLGPQMAYGVLGVGLVILALYALAAGRTTTDPLHGAAYEEATLRQAKT